LVQPDKAAEGAPLHRHVERLQEKLALPSHLMCEESDKDLVDGRVLDPEPALLDESA
jgi:hypothetical protein